VRRDECSPADADRIADRLGRANARRIYPLGDGWGTAGRIRP
jgi:hypothetical protein